MPSFKDKLSAEEIKQVAGFVATAAGVGTAGKVTFEVDDKKVDDCTDTACYEQAFGNLAYNEGPKAALDKLAELSSTNPPVRERLPSDLAQDRRRRAPEIRGRRRRGLRRRQRHVRLGLLPRPAPVEARRRRGRPGRGCRQHRVREPGRSSRTRSSTTSATTGSVTA